MKFFQMVKDSVYNPQFYKDIIEQPTSVSVKYFVKLILVVSCVVAIVPIFGGAGLLTWKHAEVEKFHGQVIEAFPADLSVRIKDGEISTNADEPYIIPFPDEMRKEMASDNKAHSLDNLLVIDTKKPIDTSDFQTYKTVLIVSKNQIGFIDPDKGKVEIQSLDKFNIDYTLDRSSFTTLVDAAWKIIKIVGIAVLVLLPFIIFAGLAIGYSIYLVFGALVVWIAANIAKKTLTYGQSYKLGLHLITLPLLMSFLLPGIFRTPFLFSFVLFVMAFINFKQPEVKADTVTQTAEISKDEANSASSENVIKDAEIEEKK